MKKLLKSKLLSFVLPLFLLFSLSACDKNDMNNTNKNATPKTSEVAPNNDKTGTNKDNLGKVTPNKDDNINNTTNNGTTKNTTDNSALSKKSKDIAAKVEKIKGVKSAKVIISNDRALVGIDMDSNIEGKLTDELKKEVENKVKSADSNIKTVAVSADAGLYQRISNVGKGIEDGRPFGEFGNEIDEIFRRIIPTK